MSRQREVAPGLRFVRPPGQDKRNVFSVGQEEFADKFQQYKTLTAAGDITAPGFAATIEQWLINSFTGLGRHLAAELVAATASASASEQVLQDDELASKLWNKVKELQTLEQVRPAMKADLSTYTVLSWWPQMEANPDWKNFPAVNDLIDEYYRLAEAQEQFNQLRDRLRSELKGETEKLEGRIAAASAHLGSGDTSDLKRCGDLVLANIHNIGSGQEELVCENIFDSTEEEAAPSAPPLVIKLNPNMSAAQNAQAFYRQFAKSRARSGAATVARNDATQRLEYVRKHLITVETSTDAGELRQIKDLLIGRKPIDQTKQQPTQAKKKNKSRLLSTTSSDGWTIYVGRNRQENDYLLSKLARPFDFWMHVQGQGGAHVLIRVPASKQDPPMTTLKEGAHVAAKLSKAASGSKVRVVYTQCRYVKKLPGDKPGLVHYEKERTLEVDTATPMPQCMKQLFQQN